MMLPFRANWCCGTDCKHVGPVQGTLGLQEEGQDQKITKCHQCEVMVSCPFLCSDWVLSPPVHCSPACRPGCPACSSAGSCGHRFSSVLHTAVLPPHVTTQETDNTINP